MKKLILSVIMSFALLTSMSVMAQDSKPKKECCKEKTECTNKCDKDKKDCKKECNKNKKEACTQNADCKKKCSKDAKKQEACCKDKK